MVHAAGTQVQLDVDLVDSDNVHLADESLTNTAEGIIAAIRGPKKWYYFVQEFTATNTLELLTIPDGPFNAAALGYVGVTKNGDCQDTDNDGIDDAFDLDSDNNGIYDAV